MMVFIFDDDDDDDDDNASSTNHGCVVQVGGSLPAPRGSNKPHQPASPIQALCFTAHHTIWGFFQTSVLFVQQYPPWLQQFKAQGATPGNVFIYVQCRSDNCSTYLVVGFLEIFQMSHVYVY